jgi:2'-5' RNA ligase
VRLFVAINFPPDLRRDLWRATESLRAARLPVRWVGADALHLTLKFLGEVQPAQRPDIERALAAAVQGARPFELGLGGFGAFPAVERPRVIWVACEGTPPLELLQHRVEIETERLGFPVEARAFRPHVTLGRVGRDAGRSRLGGLDQLLEDLAFEASCVVSAVDLMLSRPGAEGSVYEVAQSVPLAG